MLRSSSVLVLACAGLMAQTPDFSGVWMGVGNTATAGGKRNTPLPPNPPLTAVGTAKLKKNLAAGDPVEVRCWPLGPTRFMDAEPKAIEIVRNKDGFAILSTRHYLGRRWYTDGRAHPKDWDPPQYLGHATGKWEGDTLVVETRILNDKTWLNETGWPHTDEMRLEERIRLIENGKVLEDQMTVEDPKFYTTPLRFSRYWKLIPNADLPPVDYSCMERMQDKIVVSK